VVDLNYVNESSTDLLLLACDFGKVAIISYRIFAKEKKNSKILVNDGFYEKGS
jgi:hypothetical protein